MGWGRRILALCLVLSAFAPPSSGAVTLKEGIAAFKARRWEEAHRLLRQVFEADGDVRVADLAYKAAMYRCKDLVAARRYGDALEVCRFAEAYELPPRHSWAWVIHYNRGQALEALGRQDEAEAAYRRAYDAGSKKEPSVSFALGNLYFLQEDWTRSIRFLEEARKGASNPALLSRLGEAYYRNGELETAIGHLERALEASPGSAPLQGLLRKLRREYGVEESFSEGMTSHFSISFKNSSDQRASSKAVGEALERAYASVIEELGTPDGGRIPAVLYPSGKDYQSAMATPTWTAALYDGKIRIPLELVEGNASTFESTLRHELTHHVVHQRSGHRAPMWLHEGLAQLMEGQEKPRYRSLIRQIAADLERVRSKGGKPRSSIPLRQLEGQWVGRLQGDAVGIAYAEAYYLIRYLDDAYGLGKVRRYLEDLAEDRGRTVEEVMDRNFGVDYDELEAEWLLWLKNPANL